MMHVVQIPALQDNYCYLVICQATQQAALIDPCDAPAARQMIGESKARLIAVINTHHHWDHVSANEEIKRLYDCPVWAFAGDASRIPGFSRGLKEGEEVKLGELTAKVLHTPGHTRGHISLYFAREKSLFCGDTLFSGGCGRLLEGTAAEMVDSLYHKIAVLPDDTRIFCGHEYTLVNLEFARFFEPENRDLHRYYEIVMQRRNDGQPTVPSTVGLEKRINPFLRCGLSRELYENLNRHIPVENNRLALFTALRQLKDRL